MNCTVGASVDSPRHDCYQAFLELLRAQVELNSSVDRSADAFSYDDSIRFERSGGRLEIVEVDADARTAWRRDGKKFDLLHQYWLYRGMDAVMAAPDPLARVSLANLEANFQALAKAKGRWLRLQEVYGMAEQALKDTKLKNSSATPVWRSAWKTPGASSKTRKAETEQRRQRRDIFVVEDEIEARRDALIAALKKRFHRASRNQSLFVVHWSVIQCS
jgi:hypothetical protein